MKYGFLRYQYNASELKYMFNVFININNIPISEFHKQNVILLQLRFI